MISHSRENLSLLFYGMFFETFFSRKLLLNFIMPLIFINSSQCTSNLENYLWKKNEKNMRGNYIFLFIFHIINGDDGLSLRWVSYFDVSKSEKTKSTGFRKMLENTVVKYYTCYLMIARYSKLSKGATKKISTFFTVEK